MSLLDSFSRLNSFKIHQGYKVSSPNTVSSYVREKKMLRSIRELGKDNSMTAAEIEELTNIMMNIPSKNINKVYEHWEKNGIVSTLRAYFNRKKVIRILQKRNL